MPSKDERDLINQAYRWAADEFARELRAKTEDSIAADGEPDSPIERVFWVWWEAVRASDRRCSPWCRDYLELEPQREVELGRTYRLDFGIRETAYETYSEFIARAKAIGIPYPLIGIELDGHEFHEKTKEQVAYRDKRDRDLQLAGYKILHISGSALWRKPEATVLEVFEGCHDLINAWYGAVSEHDFFEQKRREQAADGKNQVDQA